MEERDCNTCSHYDPIEWVCKKTGENRYSYEGDDCDDWLDWEMDVVRKKKP